MNKNISTKTTLAPLRFCVMVVLLFVASSASAYDFAVENDDGVTIYYSFSNGSTDRVYVTYRDFPSDSPTDAYVGSVNIPKTVEYDDKTYSVVSIASTAFYNCSELTSVSIPNSVTSIGSSAFYKCTGLTSVNIPDGVTEIIGYTFYGCTSLTSVNIPDGVTSIGEGAFCECSSLTGELKIPSSVTSIGEYAFTYCSGVAEYKVSEDNQYYCDKDGVLFSKDMTTLVQFPLASPLLPSYDIPNSVTTIGTYAFWNCKSLTSLIIGENVTEIGYGAFFQCRCLVGELKIPDSVTTIGECAFEYCESLTSLNIGNGITTIGEDAFSNCYGLTHIVIPDGVTTIGMGAFYFCTGLTSLTLGTGLTTIDCAAFGYCNGLKSIYSLNPEPPECIDSREYGWNVFFRTDIVDKCVLYVPIGSYNAYATANQWEEFLNIVEMDMTGIESVIVSSDGAEVAGYYTIDGKTVDAPQHGINILRYSDGTTKKVLVK